MEEADDKEAAKEEKKAVEIAEYFSFVDCTDDCIDLAVFFHKKKKCH